jgi:hypothetical protein
MKMFGMVALEGFRVDKGEFPELRPVHLGAS